MSVIIRLVLWLIVAAAIVLPTVLAIMAGTRWETRKREARRRELERQALRDEWRLPGG